MLARNIVPNIDSKKKNDFLTKRRHPTTPKKKGDIYKKIIDSVPDAELIDIKLNNKPRWLSAKVQIQIKVKKNHKKIKKCIRISNI